MKVQKKTLNGFLKRAKAFVNIDSRSLGVISCTLWSQDGFLWGLVECQKELLRERLDVHDGSQAFCLSLAEAMRGCKLSSGEITIERVGNCLEWSSDAGIVNVTGVDGDATISEEVTPAMQGVIAGDRLKEMAAVVWPVTKDLVGRFVINGAQLEIQEDSACLVATDGHRLHMAKLICAATLRWSAILPSSVVGYLASSVPTGDVTLSLVEENRIEISCPEFWLSSRLIEARFPKWRKVVPKKKGDGWKVEVAELTQYLRKSECKKQSVYYAPSNIRMTGDDGGSSKEVSAITGKCSTMKVRYQTTYLTDAFGIYRDTCTIWPRVSEHLTATVVEGSGNGVESMVVLMPLR